MRTAKPWHSLAQNQLLTLTVEQTSLVYNDYALGLSPGPPEFLPGKAQVAERIFCVRFAFTQHLVPCLTSENSPFPTFHMFLLL